LLLTAVGAAGCLVDFSGRDADGGAPDGGSHTCGNGEVEAGEQCDGDNLAGRTCAELGFQSGGLACTADCQLDRSGCVGGCGNAVLEEGEECDDGLANSATAPDACRPDCRLPYCGDGVADSAETCDGNDLAGKTCASLGLEAGELGCEADCQHLDTSGCHEATGCGNHQVDSGETCDGNDLAGQSCASLGYTGGLLLCEPNCAGYDTTACESVFGARCTADTQCPGGFCFRETLHGWPDGLCTEDCSTNPCQSGRCAELYGSEHHCVQECVTSDDCRPGYGCFDPFYRGWTFCFPRCESDNHCPVTQQCNLYTGLCQGSSSGADTGAQCATPSDCRSTVCWQNTSNGYCVTLCSLDSGVCPGGAVCSNAMAGTTGDMGLCLKTCTSNADCPRADHTCKDDPYGSQSKVCLP
jgi:hypothetical protein